MEEDSETIQALVERLQKGDDAALAELFDLYRAKLRKMVRFRMDRRLAGRVDASDVVQDAYLDAAQRVDHYRNHENMPFFLWLRLVTGQRLVEIHRRHLGAQKRDAEREVPMFLKETPQASTVCMAAHLVGDITSPSRAAIRAESISHLEQALESMDPIDREVLALRHFEELGNDEVAELLGLTKSAASNRYVRALKRLKKILSELPDFDDRKPRKNAGS